MIRFSTSINRFKAENADWLTDTHLPALTALEHMAKELDRKLSPSIVSAFGVAYRALLAEKPREGGEDSDELDDIIPD